MLHDSDAVVALGEAMHDIPTAIGKFANIPPFKRGAGRQKYIGKLGLALQPDGLIHHKLQVV